MRQTRLTRKRRVLLSGLLLVGATTALGCKSPPAWLASTEDAGAPAPTAAPSASPVATTTDAPPIADASGGAAAATAADGGKATHHATSLDGARKEAQGALKELVAADASATKATGCEAALTTLDGALGIAQPVVTPESKGAYVYFANCARREQRWALLAHLGKALFVLEPTGPHAAYVARALVGFGQYEAAANLLVPFFKPGSHETEALVAAAIAGGRVEDDEGSMRRADDALAQLRSRTGFASEDLVADARLVRGEALFRRGRQDEALHELDGLPARDEHDPTAKSIALLRDAATRAKTSKVGILVDTPNDLFLGFSALMGKANQPLPSLASVRLYNFSGKALALHLEASIATVTQTAVKDTAFLGKKDTIKLTPAFSPLFDAGAVVVPQDATLTVRVLEGAAKNVVFEESHPVHLQPRSSLPMFIAMHGTEIRHSRDLAAAWVAPKSKTVVALVEAARTRAKLTAFAGEAGASSPQAQAVWEELAAEGFAFDRAPKLATEAAPIEAVHSPTDVAAAKGGTPREGAVLFASALAAIGLAPLLVDVPGDAYVGWLPTKADRGSPAATSDFIASPAGEAVFLEVAAIGQRPFGTAMLRANATTVEYAGKGAFADDRAGITNVAKAQKSGIAPLFTE